MEFDYNERTSKGGLPSPYDNGPDEAPVEAHNGGFIALAKHDLLRLVDLIAMELDKRDDAIQKLKEERARHLYFEAKYGRIAANDPLQALKRDSEAFSEKIDEEQIGRLYENQLAQLDKLISTHRRTHNRSKMILAATERRHSKALRELETEKERNSKNSQGDDVVAFLEKERDRLQQQLDAQLDEVEKVKQETAKCQQELQEDKEKHKTMILFLVNERKQMLLRMQEMKLRSDSTNGSDSAAALKTELERLRIDRDTLAASNKTLRAENLSLKEVVKEQDAEVQQLRRNMARNPNDQAASTAESSLVMANRMASGTHPGPASRATKISSSSSFPSTSIPFPESRLPRAPPQTTPARPKTITRLPTTPATVRGPASPTKKTPAMGLNSVRRPTSANTPGQSNASKFSADPELQQLEDAINWRADTATYDNDSYFPFYERSKHCCSHPESERAFPSRSSKTEKPVERKLSGTIKKNSFLKAFGGGGK
ncbi:unnamed protein product, partial [Mesorhabditis spiculigera]